MVFQKIKNGIKQNPLPLSTWIIALIAIILFTSILLFVFNFISYKNEKENYILTMLQNNDRQISEYTNNLLNDIESMVLLPLFSEKTSADFFTAIQEYETTGIKSVSYQEYIQQVLKTLYNYKSSNINSVFFYTSDGKYDHLLRGIGNISDYNPMKERWFSQSIKDLNGNPILFGSYDLYKPGFIDSKGAYVFGMARSIVDVKNSTVAGILQININESQLFNILDNSLFLNQQRILIVDSNNVIVSDTIRDNIGNKLEDKDLLDAQIDSAKKTSKMLINESNIGWTDWKLINSVPLESINSQINKTIGTTLVIMFLLIIFSIGLAFVIMVRIVSPIQKLIRSMSVIGKGDFDVHISENGLKETMLLSNVFNKMAEELNNHIKRQYIDKINQKELEIKMLQYQINPHFIYNSLESIKMMSLLNNDNEAALMLTSLGKLMRYSLSGSDEVVTIRHEMAMIEEYISLQSLRFNDLYQFYFDVDNEIYDYYTPKLILQPLVENAIEHGMINTLEDGEIYIKGYLKDDEIVMEIRNNGEKISNERLIWLNDYISNEDQVEAHIGLKNTNKRIKLFFGNKYGVKIYSNNEYTTVQISIPKIKCNSGDIVC